MVQKNGNMKSEPKYLACNTCFLLLLIFSHYWLLGGLTSFFFIRVARRWLRSALVHALGSANMYDVKGQSHCPPRPPLRRNVISALLCNAHI